MQTDEANPKQPHDPFLSAVPSRKQTKTWATSTSSAFSKRLMKTSSRCCSREKPTIVNSTCCTLPLEQHQLSKQNTYAYTRVASVTLAKTKTTIISNKHPTNTQQSRNTQLRVQSKPAIIKFHIFHLTMVIASLSKQKTHDNTMVASVTHGKTATATTTITIPSTRFQAN